MKTILTILLETDPATARAVGGIAIWAFLWLILSLLCAISGNNKKIGYGGSFLLCLLTSPLLGLIITLVLPNKPKPQREYKCKHCGLLTKENTHYCPRCLKDNDGYTVEQNKERFKIA